MRSLFSVQKRGEFSQGAVARKDIFEQKKVTSFGQLRQNNTYFPRNPCERWEGLSGAPAPSLRWGNAGVGESLGWILQNMFFKSLLLLNANRLECSKIMPKLGFECLTTFSAFSSSTGSATAAADDPIF